MKLIYYSPKRIFILFAIGIALVLISCSSRKIQFNQSTLVPAAEGTVKIKQNKNKNYSIDIGLTHLAQPEKLQPSRKVYVVWMDTERNGIKNLGQLKSSSGLLSKTLKASLNTVTPFKPTRIYITGEDNGVVSYPNGQQVMTTEKIR